MQPIHRHVLNPLKWLFLTALLATLGFALTSQLPHHKAHADDGARLLIVEMQEFSADNEPPSQLDDISVILTTSTTLQFGGNSNPHHLFYSEFAPRLAFLYHIRPRSPPLVQIS